MRWDLLDKFTELQKGKRALAVKRFVGDEDFFSEHYPGKPVVPETFLLEMIAQAGGVLFGLSLNFKKEVILAKIDGARFHKQLLPPCDLTVEALMEMQREEGARVIGTVKQDGEPVAEAEIFLVAMDSLTGKPGGQVVFSDKFLTHYDIHALAKTP